MFGCFFGHDWKRLGDWMVVLYEWSTGESERIQYPCRCRRCPKIDLVDRTGDYSVSWGGWQGPWSVTREEAMAKAQQLAKTSE
jgi:hypothetical protein